MSFNNLEPKEGEVEVKKNIAQRVTVTSRQRLFGACLALGACLASPALLAEAARPEADLRARVDAYLGPLIESGLFSGSVLLARGGEVVLQAGYGRADFAGDIANTPQTRFKLMSVTKSITAVAVMSLLERDKLKLTDPVAQHLAGWPKAWQGVTLHHLLSHTSGIPNLEQEWVQVELTAGGRGLELWPQLAARIKDRPLASTPGARGSYSNFNFILLGLVIEAVSERPYTDYLQSAVLDVVGMEHTGMDDGSRFPGLAMGYMRGRGGTAEESQQDMSMIQAAGGLYSTVTDLYRLDRALRQNKLLSQPTRDLMWTPVKDLYAAGWMISRKLGRRCIHHSGGANGYVADFLRFPDEDASVVVLSNFAFAPVGRISSDLAAILFAEAYDSPQVVAPELLERYTGTFRGSNQTFVVRRSGKALLLFDIQEQTVRAGGELLFPLAQDTFSSPWGGRQLQFTRDAAGGYGKLRLRVGGSTVVMDRGTIAPELWSRAVGTYGMQPESGGSAQVLVEDGRLKMRVTNGWPVELELVPISETRMIALVSESFGTMLKFHLDAQHRPSSFEWQRADGATFRGSRQQR